MTKIKFLNIPKPWRQQLVGHRFGNKTKFLDLPAANKRVKAIASKLEGDQNVKVDLEVTDGDRVYSAQNATIVADDRYAGLQSIADRLTNDGSENSSETLRLAQLIEDELRDEKNTDEVNDDIDYLFVTKDNDEKEKSNEDQNDTRPLEGVSPKTKNEEITAEKGITKKEVNKITPEASDFKPNSRNTASNFSDLEDQECVTPKAIFTAEKNIFQSADEKIATAAFNIDELKRSLGFVDNPKDQYDRQLNMAIERDLEKCHLKTAVASYESELSQLQRKAINALDSSYEEVNKNFLNDTVAGQAANSLKKNQAKAANEKNANLEEAKVKRVARFKEIDDEAAEKIAVATERINVAKKHEQESFAEEQDLLLKKRNAEIDQDLEKQNATTINTYKYREIKTRNRKLKQIHQEIENKYIFSQKKLFKQQQSQFAINTSHLERNVQSAVARIDRQRKKDYRANYLKQQHRDKITKMQEIAQLQKKSNDLRAEEIAYFKQHDSDFPQRFTATFTAGIDQMVSKKSPPPVIKPLVNENTKELKEPLAQTKKGQSAVTNTGSRRKTSDKDQKRSELLHGLIIALAGLVTLGIGVFLMLTRPKPTVDNSSTNSVRSEHSNITKPKNNLRSRQSLTAKRIHKKQSSVKVHDSNVVRYHAADNWAAKIDVLDGALGQGDVRALKEINDYHSTWLSKLYYAIASNDQSTVRAIYLQLGSIQKQKLSAAAKHAIALAYYNVHDWNNGWKARNGY